MQRKAIIRYCLIFLVFSFCISLFPLLLFTDKCWSAGNIRAGRLELHPFFKIKETYDDNIYFDAEDEVDSYITTISPGLSVSLPIKKHLFEVGYGSEILSYTENPDDNNATHRSLSGLIDLNFPVGLSFKAKGAFLDTTAPPYAELIERIKYKSRDLSTNVGFKFSKKLSFRVDQLYRSYDYYKDVYYEDRLNRREGESALTVFYQFFPKTSLLLGYDIGKIDYEDVGNLNDSEYTQMWFGVKGKITPKTRAIVRVGQQSRTYSEREDEDRDFSGATVRVTSLTDFSPRTSLKVTLVRQIIESIYFNNLYYTSSRGILTLNQRIANRWYLVIGSLYERNAYPEESTENDITQKRTDNIYGANVNLRYKVQKWLSWGIKYQFLKRDSNFDTRDYDRNIFTADIIDYMLDISLQF